MRSFCWLVSIWEIKDWAEALEEEMPLSPGRSHLGEVACFQGVFFGIITLRTNSIRDWSKVCMPYWLWPSAM